MEQINRNSVKAEHLSNVLSIPEYINHLSRELEIEDTYGLNGNELELIALIRNCPFLYDKSYPDFKVIEKKEQAWKAIAEVFNVSTSELYNHWKHMRESFRRFTSKRNLDPNMKACVTYFDEMNFLLPFIQRRNRSSGTLSNAAPHLKEDCNTSASSEPEITNTDHELKLEVLIETVSANPILYDRRHEDAKNHDAKLRTWKKIAQNLAIPVSDCVNKWKILRERYTRERKYRKGNPNGRKWFLFDKLSFLEDHVLSRKRFSRSQMQNEKSKGIFTEIKTDLAITSNLSSTEHQYCEIIDDGEDQGHSVEYITVEDLNRDQCFGKCDNKDDLHSTSAGDDSFRDEDDLFGLAITAEMKKISNTKKKMKLKADIYRLLYEHSD